MLLFLIYVSDTTYMSRVLAQTFLGRYHRTCDGETPMVLNYQNKMVERWYSDVDSCCQ